MEKKQENTAKKRAENTDNAILITVKDGDKEYACRLKRPDVASLARSIKMGKADEVLGAQELLKSCWIDGDAEIMEDGYLMVAVVGEMNMAARGITAEIKN